MINVLGYKDIENYMETLGIEGKVIHFVESTLDGNPGREPFSLDFIAERVMTFSMDIDSYTHDSVEAIEEISEEDDLTLWFGHDLANQMNLLLFLAYLETIGYDKRILLHIIDTKNMMELKKVVITVESANYYYEEILGKHNFIECPIESINQVLPLYDNILQKTGPIAFYILQNKECSQQKLINDIQSRYKEYGLNPVQIANYIKDVLN